MPTTEKDPLVGRRFYNSYGQICIVREKAYGGLRPTHWGTPLYRKDFNLFQYEDEWINKYLVSDSDCAPRFREPDHWNAATDSELRLLHHAGNFATTVFTTADFTSTHTLSPYFCGDKPGSSRIACVDCGQPKAAAHLYACNLRGSGWYRKTQEERAYFAMLGKIYHQPVRPQGGFEIHQRRGGFSPMDYSMWSRR